MREKIYFLLQGTGSGQAQVFIGKEIRPQMSSFLHSYFVLCRRATGKVCQVSRPPRVQDRHSV